MKTNQKVLLNMDHKFFEHGVGRSMKNLLQKFYTFAHTETMIIEHIYNDDELVQVKINNKKAADVLGTLTVPKEVILEVENNK